MAGVAGAVACPCFGQAQRSFSSLLGALRFQSGSLRTGRRLDRAGAWGAGQLSAFASELELVVDALASEQVERRSSIHFILVEQSSEPSDSSTTLSSRSSKWHIRVLDGAGGHVVITSRSHLRDAFGLGAGSGFCERMAAWSPRSSCQSPRTGYCTGSAILACSCSCRCRCNPCRTRGRGRGRCGSFRAAKACQQQRRASAAGLRAPVSGTCTCSATKMPKPEAQSRVHACNALGVDHGTVSHGVSFQYLAEIMLESSSNLPSLSG